MQMLIIEAVERPSVDPLTLQAATPDWAAEHALTRPIFPYPKDSIG
jgi:hypothetical protein